MSYDIGLYEEAFLKRAFEQNLGDWTQESGYAGISPILLWGNIIEAERVRRLDDSLA